jgi:glycosyltransferase involved in cell wall biosynthesis
MSEPLVSVLLPVYNARPYLAAALESILRQDHQRLEIIAIDDGSTDNCLEILERYRRADRRIVIVSRENRGLIATLNEAMSLASGDLVARMDADDIAYPARLSRQVAAFGRQPELAICGTGVDTLMGNRLTKGTANPIYQFGNLRILSLFFTLFLHSTVVYNRKVLSESDIAYDEDYKHAEDFDLFRRIADRYPVKLIDESLLAYRRHLASVTSKHKNVMRQTHLKIVSENVAREGLLANTGALGEIGRAVTVDTVGRAADFMIELDEKVAGQPTEFRASYEEGALNLFYFLYQLIGDEEKPQLTHAFLTKAARWAFIRRRERYSLHPGAYAPWLSLASIAATKQVDAVAWYFKSVPAATVLPRHRLLEEA